MTVLASVGEICEAVSGTVRGPAEVPVEGFAIDTGEVVPGCLFIGITGARVDGSMLAPQAAAAGAAAVLVSEQAAVSPELADLAVPVIAVTDTVAALAELAIAKRAAFEGTVIAVTGSTGKTSTKDILGAILAASGRVFSTSGNRNTEIGMPLEILKAPLDAVAWVLELAMRAEGEIAELTRIATPDAGVIVNVGPVHLETLGSIERVAGAKAELVGGLREGAASITPAGESLLEPYLREDLVSLTFGPDGDCRLAAADGRRLTVELNGSRYPVEVDFDQPHNRLNLLAAAAAALACGFTLPERLEVPFSGLRGQRESLDEEVVVINDCYNANPMSMRAALADLGEEAARRGGRRIAVLGDMLELGSDSDAMHRELGRSAAAAGVDLLISVGPLAAASAAEFAGESAVASDASQVAGLLAGRVREGDTVLIKGSRGVGLERVLEDLRKAGD